MKPRIQFFLRYIGIFFTQIKFRKIKIPNASEIINTEDSSVHWRHLDVKGKNVLDLGCGLYDVSNLTESSPVYFMNKGANRVIGVDANKSDVEVFENYFKEHFPTTKSRFFCQKIETSNDVVRLIETHDIEAIKCDIEGYEKVLFKIKNDQLKKVKSISIEYHNHALMLRMIDTLNQWNFGISNHSLFSYGNFYMGVLTATRN